MSTAKDKILNSQYLVLPTIMVLKSSHNIRFAEESKILGNHVTCCWQEQIILYKSKRTYPFSLPNLHFTCGATLDFEDLASSYSLVPRPYMMSPRHNKSLPTFMKTRAIFYPCSVFWTQDKKCKRFESHKRLSWRGPAESK